jgi:hypothetical protein
LMVLAELLAGMSLPLAGLAAVVAVVAGFPSCARAAVPAAHSSAANPALHRPNLIFL